MAETLREHLIDLIARWKRGNLTEAEVQEAAENLLEGQQPMTEITQDEYDSIPFEVLSYLEALPALLVTRDDADAIIRFLRTSVDAAEEGWREWRRYWEGVDELSRRQSLSGDPFYFA